MIREHILGKKSDLKHIPPRTTKIRVRYPLVQEDATTLMRNCRLLEEVVFSWKAYSETDETVKDYLERCVYIEAERNIF